MRLEDQTTLDPAASYDGEATLEAGVGEPRVDPAPEPEQVDRFRLERLLGQGGMGQVWEAWDPQLERPVAIKRLLRADPQARRRFVREARLQATLAHPGICPVFEVGQDAGEPYLVMPRLDGVRLDEAVEGEPLEYKLDLMRQVADAIHTAHQEGLIHRDLKPANILVEHPSDAPARPVVLDFGIARPVGGEMLTAPGEVVGTPAYMAPEQVEGASVQLDRRTDVYALGATLYRLLCGRPPHSGTGTPLLLSIVHEEPERLPSGDIPAEVEAIVFKCLEKDKSRRYDSARALAEDLGRYLAGEPVHARPVTRWIRLGKWMRRHRMAVRITSAATLLAVAGLAWGAWSAWRSGERQDAARRFGAQVEEIEALARYSHLVPLHDVRQDHKQLRIRLDAIRPSLEDRDPVVRALAAHAMGRGHLALDELEEARKFLETAHGLDPENPEIAADLGRTLSEIYRDRLTDLERFGDQEKRDALGKQLSAQLADTFENASELQRQSEASLATPALDLLQRGRSRGLEDAAELDVLILFHDGRFEEALDLLAKAPPAPSWMYERWRLEGDIRRSYAVSLYRNGQTAEDGAAKHQLKVARLAYGRALAVAPSHAGLLIDDAQTISLLVRLGLVRLNEGEPLIEQAQHCLKRARIADPEGPIPWLWSVRIELVAAHHALTRAQDPAPYLKSALELGRLAQELHDQNHALWYELGRTHELLARRQRGRGQDPSAEYELAVKAFDQVPPADRDYAYHTSVGILRMALADHLTEQGLKSEEVFESAIASYRSAAELHSKPFVSLFNLGVALLKSANIEGDNRMAKLTRAVDAFEHTHHLQPDRMEPIYQLGLSRQRLAKEISQDNRLVDRAMMERAISDLRRAVEVAPDRFEPWIGLAGALRLNAFDTFNRGTGTDVLVLLVEARKTHQRALELAPNQPVALLNSGQVEYLAGKLALRRGQDPTAAAAASESLCQRSLEIRYRANALHCMGDALSLQAEHNLKREEYEAASNVVVKAEQFFREALSNDGDHLPTLQSFAWLLTLKARQLRQTGHDPTQTLDLAGQLLDQAFAVDDQEVASSLTEVHLLWERAEWLRATQKDATQPMAAGRQTLSQILARIPRSPEARRLTSRFAESTQGSSEPAL